MSQAVLRNVRVVSDGQVTEGDLWVTGDRVAGIGRVRPGAQAREQDLHGATVLPGLIDLQVNGLGGAEVYGASAAELETIVRAAPRLGCTSLLLTQISGEPAVFSHLAAALGAVPEVGARVLGIHVEGPFLNPAYPGAHPPTSLRHPSRDEAAATLGVLGKAVKLWTLAPELPGADLVIDLLQEEQVVVAAGHSALGFEDALHWFRRGVSMVTHLYNAMSGLHHRRPGLAAAALADDRVRFSIIADGHHCHPAMIQLAQRLGGERLILVTDASSPTGAADGQYTVAGRGAVAADGVVRLPDGTLAGSALSAIEAVTNLARYAGLTMPEASKAMTSRPAALLGLNDLGRLHEGARADFIVLNQDGGLAQTWVRGKPEYVGRP